ncbi:MAG: hypothetical protein IKM77_08970 [Prevotella sp.]|nr:hypothetical protein [Prevotella sp.]
MINIPYSWYRTWQAAAAEFVSETLQHFSRHSHPHLGMVIDISIGKQQPQYTLLQIGSQALTLQMPDCLNNYY